jgi:hydrogenase maturation protease
MVSIIGIGSPFGEDSAGLEAARRLRAEPPPGARVICADRPGAGLLDLLEGAEVAILIDAARSGAPAGTLHDLDLRRTGAIASCLVSSHQIGIREALELARALGRAPRFGRILAIEATAGVRRRRGLSPAVDAGVDRAVERARRWAAVLERFAHPRRAARRTR